MTTQLVGTRNETNGVLGSLPFSVENVAALQAIPTPTDGMRIFVRSLLANFEFRIGSTLPSLSCQVVADGDNTGKWIRQVGGHAQWRAQETWVVDSSAGNDENTGVDSSHAIRTLRELYSRWGPKAYLAVSTPASSVAISVSLVGNFGASDLLNLDVVLGPETCLAFIGQRTTLVSGTLSSASNQTRSTNTPATVTSSSITSAHVGKRIRVTSGARLDQCAWITQSNGSDVFTISTPSKPAFGAASPFLSQLNFFTAAVTPGTISTDPFVVEDLTQVYAGDLRATQVKSTSPTYGVYGIIAFQDIDFQVTSGLSVPSVIGNCFVNYIGCRFAGIYEPTSWEANLYHENCCATKGVLATAGNVVFNSGAALKSGAPIGGVTAFSPQANVLLDADFHVYQGSVVALSGGQLNIGTCCIRNAAANAYNGSSGVGLLVGAGGYQSSPSSTCVVKNFGYAANALWGGSNAAYGVKVGSGGRLACASPSNITITGSSGDFILGSDTSVLAQDPATGSYSGAARACSWANLAAAFGSSGFGGNVINIKNGAGIVSI